MSSVSWWIPLPHGTVPYILSSICKAPVGALSYLILHLTSFPLIFLFSFFPSVGSGNALFRLPKCSVSCLHLLMVFAYVSADTWGFF